MRQKHSIPQGRKNLVSDYFGYLYLVPFDLHVTEIIQSKILIFKGVVRYVDDIFVIFEKNDINISPIEIFKEILTIEGSINSWLQRELGLSG